MTSVEPYDDGRFDIEVVGRPGSALDALDTSGPFLVGQVTQLPDEPAQGRYGATRRARALETFADYRARLSELRGADVLTATSPATRRTCPTPWRRPAC